MQNLHQFATGSALCWECYGNEQAYTCDACHKLFQQAAFDARILSHASAGERRRVCIDCQANGYDPKDVTSYTCSRGHSCGHLKFDCQLLYDVKRGNSAVLTCKDCARTTQTYKCDACAKHKKKEQFDIHVFQHAAKHKRKLVCFKCQHDGFSTKDCEPYVCKGCTMNWGHLRFGRNALKDAKREKGILCCAECVERKQTLPD